MRRSTWTRLVIVGAAALGILTIRGVPARAGTSEALGPNSDFPDSNLVMPFAAKGSRLGFFAISNIGQSAPDDTPVPVTWEFYDESGELLISVQRYILGEGGTDVVDVSAVRSRSADGTLGPSTSLVGHNGFVVVSKDDGEPDLLGNWTIADVNANSAFGTNGAGLGYVGILEANTFSFGTSFAPSSLGDNLLILLGIDDTGTPPTSLTQGNPPNPGETVFAVRISLHSNDAPTGVLASVDVPVSGSALFASLQDLFPGMDITTSVTIVTTPITEGVSNIGFYGQAVGQFGAGQSLRTDLPLQ